MIVFLKSAYYFHNLELNFRTFKYSLKLNTSLLKFKSIYHQNIFQKFKQALTSQRVVEICIAKITMLFIAFFAISTAIAIGDAKTVKCKDDCKPWWRYEGKERGQDHWCCKGAHLCCGLYQSPINIDIRFTTYDQEASCLTLINYQLLPKSMALHNNGHTVELLYNAYNKTVIPTVFNGPFPNSSRFTLDRVHFHWGSNSTHGSEHTLNYLQLPLEMQLIHRNIKYNSLAEARNRSDGLVIISVLFKVSRNDNNKLRGLTYYLKGVTWNGQYKCIPPFPILDLLPPSYGFYYNYNGSITAPPCFESVQWIVFHNPVCISEYQLNEFRKLQEETNERCPCRRCNLVNNFRRAKCVKGRIIKWKEECLQPPHCTNLPERIF